jgi:hypothetical protein
MADAGRLAAITRRRREKLRLLLLQRFGALSLSAVEAALGAAQELFVKHKEDFQAVLEELSSKVYETLQHSTATPAHPDVDWPSLIRHQAEVQRIIALDEQLSIQQKKAKYKEELDELAEKQRLARLRVTQRTLEEDLSLKQQMETYMGKKKEMERQSSTERMLKQQQLIEESLHDRARSKDWQVSLYI